MTMKVVPEAVASTHKLPEEQARPIVHDFVKQIGIRESGAKLEDSDYQDLNGPFEQLFNVYKSVRDKEDHDSFGKFMSEVGKTLGQHEQIKSYLGNKDLTIVACSNKAPATEGAFVTSEEAHRTAKGSLIAVRVGDYVQSVKITDTDVYFSQLVKVKAGENSTLSYDATIWVASTTAETKKANIFSRMFFGVLSAVRCLITWPFQSKTRLFLSTSVVVGLIAVGMQTGHIPTIPESVAAPLRTYAWELRTHTWDKLPSWDATTTFVGDLKTKWIG